MRRADDAGQGYATPSAGDWERFLRSQTGVAFQQMPAWAEADAPSAKALVRVIAASAAGPMGAQIVRRPHLLARWHDGFARRGPIATGWTPAAVASFTVAVRAVAKKLRMARVVVDPEIAAGGLEGRLLVAAGWRRRPAIQVNHTRMIDLRRSAAELWHDLSPTARWSTNKSRRLGLWVDEPGCAGLPEFRALYREHEARLGKRLRYRARFQEVYEAFQQAGAARLLIARDPQGDSIASLLLIDCGPRVFELYNASRRGSPEAKVANYLLQWEAIRRSQERGFAVFDMWGTDELNLARFKGHFGGDEFHYDGAFELVIDRRALIVDAALRRLAGLSPMRRLGGLAGASGVLSLLRPPPDVSQLLG